MGLYTLPKLFHPDFALPGKQPIESVEIDWDNPITRGLQTFADASTGWKNIVRNSLVQAVDSSNNQVAIDEQVQSARRVQKIGSSTGYLWADTPIAANSDNRFTVVFFAELDPADTSRQDILLSEVSAGSKTFVRIDNGATTRNTQARFYLDGGGFVQPTIPNGAWVYNKPQMFGFSSTTNTEGEWLVNETAGIWFPNTTTNDFTLNGEWTLGRFNGRDTGSTNEVTGWVGPFMYWNRGLSATELWSLKQDPYQVLKPAIPLTLVTSEAAGGVSVTPGTESVIVTGLAPTVTASGSVSVTPGTESVTITGQTPTVTTTANVTATPGTESVVITGLAPTVTAAGSASVTPGTESVEITGLAPTATASDHQSVTPGTESVVITGLAPVIQISDHQTATPGTEAVEITGLAPVVSITEALSVTPGTESVVVTGYAPTVSAIALPVAEKTYYVKPIRTGYNVKAIKTTYRVDPIKTTYRVA